MKCCSHPLDVWCLEREDRPRSDAKEAPSRWSSEPQPWLAEMFEAANGSAPTLVVLERASTVGWTEACHGEGGAS